VWAIRRCDGRVLCADRGLIRFAHSRHSLSLVQAAVLCSGLMASSPDSIGDIAGGVVVAGTLEVCGVMLCVCTRWWRRGTRCTEGVWCNAACAHALVASRYLPRGRAVIVCSVCAHAQWVGVVGGGAEVACDGARDRGCRTMHELPPSPYVRARVAKLRCLRRETAPTVAGWGGLRQPPRRDSLLMIDTIHLRSKFSACWAAPGAQTALILFAYCSYR
jgi:hypothetical protein